MGAVFVYAVKEKMYGWPIIWTHRYSAQFGPFSLIALDGRKLRQMRKEIKSRKIPDEEKDKFLTNVQQPAF